MSEGIELPGIGADAPQGAGDEKPVQIEAG